MVLKLGKLAATSLTVNRSYLVALIDELMSTSNELKAVDVVELGSDFIAEQPSSSAR